MSCKHLGYVSSCTIIAIKEDAFSEYVAVCTFSHSRNSVILWCLQMAGVPLPLAEHGVSPSDIYDLHIAHADSGATDHSCTPYIAPIWKQFNEGVPQVRLAERGRAAGEVLCA